MDGIDDAVVSHADAIEPLFAAELFDTRRSGTVGERLDPGVDPLPDVPGQRCELTLDAREDLEAVAQSQIT